MNPDLELLIGRAALNKTFRLALLANPETTLKEVGIALTKPEISQLKELI